MKNDIIRNLGNPRQLEKLYRENKTTFKKEFNIVYPQVSTDPAAQIWHERLNFENEEISWGSVKDLVFVITASLIAGLIAKIPDFTSIPHDYFYPRNISFIVFPFLAAYFAWKQKVPVTHLIIVAVAFVISSVYINFLPDNPNSDTLILACIHLPLLMWSLVGITFVGNKLNHYDRRLDFLRYNGDFIVMTAIIMIAGGLMTGITIGLFELIDIKIEEFYFQYVGIWGLSAIPIVATYLVRTNPHLVNKVSPVIARVFTPLVLVTLVIYLSAVIYTGKDPYNDREFLMIFNVMLIGVMAIILFSLAATSGDAEHKINTLLLLSLSIVTVIVNGIALSAILFRIAEWGLTPNRLAVLGGNMLMLTNLLMVSYRLFRTVINRKEIENVEKSIAIFLPVYIIWTFLVTFMFPLIFGFK